VNIVRDYAPHTIVYYAYARHALVDALLRAGVQTGSTVALPAFICRDVLASIHALGATACYYDLDESLAPLDLSSLHAAQAIVAVNYFGFPQDLAPFNDYCARYGARLIEDNAHGLFSRDSGGALLGTRGEFGILSMRKSFHVSTGAALIAPAQDTLQPQVPCSNRADSSLDRLRYWLSRSERATRLPLMPIMRSAIRMGRRLAGKPAVTISTDAEEIELPSHRTIGCSALRTLNNQDSVRESMRRRALFAALAPAIGTIPGVSLLHDHLDDGVVPYGVAFRADHDAIAAVEKVARRYHVTTMSWPALPSAIAASAPDHYRNVWLVNFI
jgi:hypothetical protein